MFVKAIFSFLLSFFSNFIAMYSFLKSCGGKNSLFFLFLDYLFHGAGIPASGGNSISRRACSACSGVMW